MKIPLESDLTVDDRQKMAKALNKIAIFERSIMIDWCPPIVKKNTKHYKKFYFKAILKLFLIYLSV